jgi:hypothetical protein
MKYAKVSIENGKSATSLVQNLTGSSPGLRLFWQSFWGQICQQIILISWLGRETRVAWAA